MTGGKLKSKCFTKNRYNLYQVCEVLMTPDTLLPNHYNCLLKILQFDLCLVSEIFTFFHVFISDFACNGRQSAAGLGHLVHQGYD